MRAVENRASLKRWAGHPLFVYSALTTWLTGYDRQHPHFRVETREDAGIPSRRIDDGFFSVVLNTNPYTYLGNRPLDLSPAAGLDKPLVVITFRTMAVSTILKTLTRALRGGGLSAQDALGDDVTIFENVHELVVDHDTPFPYQVDGDYLGESSGLHFEHVPDAVSLAFAAAKEPDAVPAA